MRIVWITNLSAPYRRPVWSALAREVELWVGLLANTEANRNWSPELPLGVHRLNLDSTRVRISRTPLYVLRRRALSGVSACDAVVLPGWEHPATWQIFAE